MSHASIVVALSREDLETARQTLREPRPESLDDEVVVHAAVTQQMTPFDEQEEWFKEGSRWDWWEIGGRYTGRLDPLYDPQKDPANLQPCEVCDGTGRRNDVIGRQARQQDPSYTCNGCDGAGHRVKWPSEWRDVGNTAYRRDLKEETFVEARRIKYEALWAKWEAEADKNPTKGQFVFGIREGETREQFLERTTKGSLTAYAFLRNREWHEQARLGWFGGIAHTECEIKAEEEGKAFEGRCLHRDEETGAKIVSWTGPKDSEEQWNLLYWRRFIQNLPDDTLLVMVDYHV